MEALKKAMPYQTVDKWIWEVHEGATNAITEPAAEVIDHMKRDVQRAGYDVDNPFVYAYLEGIVLEWKDENKNFVWEF